MSDQNLGFPAQPGMPPVENDAEIEHVEDDVSTESTSDDKPKRKRATKKKTEGE